MFKETYTTRSTSRLASYPKGRATYPFSDKEIEYSPKPVREGDDIFIAPAINHPHDAKTITLRIEGWIGTSLGKKENIVTDTQPDFRNTDSLRDAAKMLWIESSVIACQRDYRIVSGWRTVELWIHKILENLESDTVPRLSLIHI